MVEPSKEEAAQIRSRSCLFEEQANPHVFEDAIHNNRRVKDNFDIDTFHHRFTNIETMLYQLRKFQLTAIFMLLVLLFVIYYNTNFKVVEW